MRETCTKTNRQRPLAAKMFTKLYWLLHFGLWQRNNPSSSYSYVWIQHKKSRHLEIQKSWLPSMEASCKVCLKTRGPAVWITLIISSNWVTSLSLLWHLFTCWVKYLHFVTKEFMTRHWYMVINRPGKAGAVFQTPLSFIIH